MNTHNYISTIERVVFANNIYSKNILKFKKNKKIGVLDFYTNVSNAFIPKKYKIGQSIPYKNVIFKHKNYKELRFKGFLKKESLNKDYSFALKVVKTLKTLKKRENLRKLILSYPVKGGLYAYSFGMSGFMPRSHVKKTIIKTLRLKFQKAKDLATKLFFYNLHRYNNLMTLYFSFKLGKLTLFPTALSNNFALKDSKRKRKENTARLNIVFLAQK